MLTLVFFAAEAYSRFTNWLPDRLLTVDAVLGARLWWIFFGGMAGLRSFLRIGNDWIRIWCSWATQG